MSAEQTLASVWRIRNADSSVIQCTAKSAGSAEPTNSCVEDQDADSSATMHYKRCKERRTNWHLCQRIRMLTPLQHSALQRALESAQEQTWQLCQRIRR
jgi:hypothetical protein